MVIRDLCDAWRRRYWREDAAATVAFSRLRPLVVVTGGSEGIGFALASQFARAGDTVLLVARRPEQLDTARTKLLETRGVSEVHVLALDVTAADAPAALDAALARLGGYADVLVNSAGMGLSGKFASHGAGDIEALVDLNVGALTRLTRHVLPGMLARGRGGVLNMASVGSYGPGPNQAAYYASKAYVLSLTEAIAHETAGMGIRVCAIAPGPVRTRFHKRMGAEKAIYRMLVPPGSADLVGWLGYRAYRLGFRVIWPGLLTPAAALSMRLMPHRLLNPIVATLLKPRK